ncbi:MAG: MetQ/NlpA family ABC transporter substrate-binding protein [Clostridia bacterium]|nr:MetQ/NlpA family ABC transporter substrate-binding protein [Clostridia bacterium]MDD4798365.1 MetQ/NlpA family ABC transporter substrate-binding protein [Clostridia bacterium]
MKKVFAIILICCLALTVIAGCSSEQPANEPAAELQPIIVGASVTPHGEILNAAKEELAAKGYDLQIVEFNDYVQPNLNLESGDLDANYFQHLPYLEDFNLENGTKLVSLAAIHYEPFGIYAGKTAAIADLADGAVIAVPNDTTNEARALLLLEAQGLIKLNPDAGLKATKIDIVENTKNLDIREMEAAQLTRTLPDVDMAVINGNYAIQAGLNASTDALAVEAADSLAAETFANIIAIREGDEAREDLAALVEVLTGETVKAFINDTYQGAVVPMF